MIVTWVFTLLFIGMAGYITYYSATHKQELINNSYNGRQQILIAQNTRGRIFSAEGEVLARTTTDSEGKEKREYPYQNLFSHVVGYASNGRMGVEAQANYYLINTSAFPEGGAGLKRGKISRRRCVYHLACRSPAGCFHGIRGLSRGGHSDRAGDREGSRHGKQTGFRPGTDFRYLG